MVIKMERSIRLQEDSTIKNRKQQKSTFGKVEFVILTHTGEFRQGGKATS